MWHRLHLLPLKFSYHQIYAGWIREQGSILLISSTWTPFRNWSVLATAVRWLQKHPLRCSYVPCLLSLTQKSFHLHHLYTCYSLATYSGVETFGDACGLDWMCLVLSYYCLPILIHMSYITLFDCMPHPIPVWKRDTYLGISASSLPWTPMGVYFFRPVGTWWVMWSVPRQSPLIPRTFLGTPFRVTRRGSPDTVLKAFLITTTGVLIYCELQPRIDPSIRGFTRYTRGRGLLFTVSWDTSV